MLASNLLRRQPAGYASHKVHPAVGCHYFVAVTAVAFPAPERHRPWPVPIYSARWTDVHMWMTFLRSMRGRGMAGDRTGDLWIASPSVQRAIYCANTPHNRTTLTNYKQPALTRVQRLTPAAFVTRDLDCWTFDRNISSFPGLFVEIFCAVASQDQGSSWPSRCKFTGNCHQTDAYVSWKIYLFTKTYFCSYTEWDFLPEHKRGI